MSVNYTAGVFSGASGAVTTSAALATTYTGLVLTNPVGSPVSLVLQAASYAPLVAQTSALSIGLMGGYSTTAVVQTTAVTPSSNYLGSGWNVGGSGLLAKAATLPVAPTLLFVLGSLTTGAITVQMQGGGFIDLNDGQNLIVVPPGGFIAWYTSVASAATSVNLSLQWAEVPQ